MGMFVPLQSEKYLGIVCTLGMFVPLQFEKSSESL